MIKRGNEGLITRLRDIAKYACNEHDGENIEEAVSFLEKTPPVLKVPITDRTQDLLNQMDIPVTADTITVPRWVMDYLVGQRGYSVDVFRAVEEAYKAYQDPRG